MELASSARGGDVFRSGLPSGPSTVMSVPLARSRYCLAIRASTTGTFVATPGDPAWSATVAASAMLTKAERTIGRLRKHVLPKHPISLALSFQVKARIVGHQLEPRRQPVIVFARVCHPD